MNLEDAKNLITVLGGLVAILALWNSFSEYRRQGAQKRAEYFLEMRKRLKENTTFKEICELLEDDSQELTDIPFKEKRDFLGLFEEVAIMVNSGLIRKEVAHYMFGYYAIRCWRSRNFWENVNRDSPYWRMFRIFAEQMEVFEVKRALDLDKLKF